MQISSSLFLGPGTTPKDRPPPISLPKCPRAPYHVSCNTNSSSWFGGGQRPGLHVVRVAKPVAAEQQPDTEQPPSLQTAVQAPAFLRLGVDPACLVRAACAFEGEITLSSERKEQQQLMLVCRSRSLAWSSWASLSHPPSS
jgi:hypothetical protein